MLTDLYQRAYTDLFPTADCYCGVRVVVERVRKATPQDPELRWGMRYVEVTYDAITGQRHLVGASCDRGAWEQAYKRNREEALRIPKRTGRRRS